MKKRIWIAFVGVALFALPVRAQEQSCTTDQDCPKGLVCMPMPCPEIACEDPAECPECPDVSVCVEQGDGDWGGIWWGQQCETDADCPFAFACEEVEILCLEDGCAPCACECKPEDPACGCECPPCLDPKPCEPTTEKVCIYRERECEQDLDCGEGFWCEPRKVCTGGGGCAGCACPECAEGEECPPCECPVPEPCSYEEPVCELVGHFCALEERPCQQDGDCPKDWTCEVVRGKECICATCTCESPEIPDDGTDSSSEDCVCPPCECEESLEQGVCLPPGWGAVYREGGTKGPVDEMSGGDTEEEKAGGEGTPQDGATPMAALPGTETSSSKGGCQAAGPAETLPLWLMVTGFLLRRRRAR